MVLPNWNGIWKPGVFVKGHVITKVVNVPILIPKSALFTFEGQPSVFIKSGEGFKPQAVSTGISNENFIQITHGLQKGQKYASKGAFTIKAELMKESFGGHIH